MNETMLNNLFDVFFGDTEKRRLFPEIRNEPVSPMGSNFKDDGELYVLNVRTCNLIDNKHVDVEYDDAKNAVTIRARFSDKKEVEPYSDYCAVSFDWYITKPLPEDAVPDTLTAKVKNGVITIAVKKRTSSYFGDKEDSTSIKITRLKS